MYYNDIPYNDSLFNNLNRARQKLSKPAIRNFWSRTTTNCKLPQIISGLCYFTGTHCAIRAHNINRSDNPPYTIRNILDNIIRYNNYDGVIPSTYAVEDSVEIPYTFLHIDVVHVKAHITNTFEQYASQVFITEKGYLELNNFSLAFKLTPRHRVRVYTKVIEKTGFSIKHVVLLTASNAFDYDNNMLLFRKLVATIPLLDTRTPEQMGTVQQERINVFRKIEVTEDAAIYLRHVQEYLNTLDAFKNLEYLELMGTLKGLNEVRRSSLANLEAQCLQNIQNVEEQLSQYLREQRTLQYEMASLSNEALSEDELNMLITKKVVSNVNIDRHQMTYVTEAPCLSFDKDAARVYYNNLDDKNTIFARLFKLAFVDETIIIKFYDVVKIDFNDCAIKAQGINQPTGSSVGLRNPHHYHYNCWGNYSSPIKKLIQQYSYLQLFLQVKAATGSLNMTDYTVLRRFATDVENMYHYEINGYTGIVPSIIWREENNLLKAHSIKETLEHYNTGGNSNETN